MRKPSKHCWVRPTKVEEYGQVLEWLKRISDINLIDPGSLNYPANEFYTVDKGGEPVLHTFLQNCYFWDALAPAPDATELDEAQALKAMTQAVALKAREKGYGEVFFLCSDPRVIRFCQSHGYKQVNIPLFRLKLNELP